MKRVCRRNDRRTKRRPTRPRRIAGPWWSVRRTPIHFQGAQFASAGWIRRYLGSGFVLTTAFVLAALILSMFEEAQGQEVLPRSPHEEEPAEAGR